MNKQKKEEDASATTDGGNFNKWLFALTLFPRVKQKKDALRTNVFSSPDERAQFAFNAENTVFWCVTYEV